MRFFKYLIFLVLAFFSVNAFAQWQTSNWISTGKTALEACIKSTSDKGYKNQRIESISDTHAICYADYNGIPYSDDVRYIAPVCESGKTVYLDGYITKSDGFPPDSVCSNGCKYTKESDGLAFDTPNGNLNWGFDAKTTGEQCDVETPKGEDTPNKPKMDECKNENGSDAYCAKDPNKECPENYKEQMFNDEKLCVKNSDPNDPNASQPTDPNDPNASQPGTGGGTDLSGVISAIKSVGNAITNAINSLSKTLTDAINKNGKNTVDAIDKNTAEVKKGNGFLEEIKDWLFNDELPASADNKAVTDSDLLEDNESTFRFSAQCPAPVTEQISIIGYSWTFSFSFESYCTVLTRLAPYFVFSAYLAAAFIIAGVRDA